MIAKKEWFALGPSGIRPVGWEGYVYFALYALAVIGIVNLPVAPMAAFALAAAVLLLLVLDMSALRERLLPTAVSDLRAQWRVSALSFLLLVTLLLALFLYRLLVQGEVDRGVVLILIAALAIKLVVARI